MPSDRDAPISRVRVLHVIPSVAAAQGGPSRAIDMMERALLGAGVDVELATTDDDGPGRRKPPHSIAAELAQRNGNPLRQAAYHLFPKRIDFYKIAPGLAAWMRKHVADYDLVHIHAMFSFPSVAAARAARHAGVPYIVRPLGTLTRYGIEQRRPWLKQASLRWIDGPVLQHAAAVHFTAAAEWDEARQLRIPMRPAIVPLAVEVEAVPDAATLFDRFSALRRQPYALFLSRLDPKKNVEALLDAMSLLASDRPELRLAIVGDGRPEYVAQLKARAASLGIEDRVVWTGFLTGPLKAAVLEQAALFVLPSYSENFGIAAAEALLAGLPCVLGKGVAIAAEIEAAGAGMVVEPHAAATAQAMQHYLSDAQERQAAGLAARRYAADHYSLDAMGTRLKALYETVLREQRAPHARVPA